MTLDTNAENKAQAVNFSLYKRDIDDIQEKADTSGVQGRSAALRLILQEWRQWRDILQAADTTKVGALL
jgi:hypothetical protein